ncbi:MAG TPA: hypothetical protein P5154_05660, partial [Candidatus Izemoplasmatales bacterium]|nr:hypothetical protein [Candidatus Izemoplasmatales bacterium]
MTQIVRDFISNGTLLFALVFLYGALDIKPMRKKPGQSIISGLIIGGFAILLMEMPWRFAEGLIFD